MDEVAGTRPAGFRIAFQCQFDYDFKAYERACTRQFEAIPLQSIGLRLTQLRIVNPYELDLALVAEPQ